MRRGELPAVLNEAFAVHEAVAAGVSRSRLRARDLVAPFHGVRAVAPHDESTRIETQILDRARQYAARMKPHEFFSHATSAVIWGLPVPFSALKLTLDVAVSPPHRLPRSAGVQGHEVASGLVSVRQHPASGLQVASPASTWAMLGSVLRNRYDLVAVGDAAVRAPRLAGDPPAMASIEQLGAAVNAGRRVGVGVLREALDRIRERAASRPETWLRLLIVDAGLPEPELNHDVFDDAGLWLACVDQAYPHLKIAFEYEGLQHLTDAGQWVYDIGRYEALVAAGGSSFV